MKILRRLLVVCALVAAAVLLPLAIGWQLAPPAARIAEGRRDPRVMRGAFHVHTTVSDGAGTREQVADAAARAGLDFVVLTDHGDGTRPPEPPRYVDGVLLVDAVEISTTGGHLLAFGLSQTPYPLGGEPRDVIEDVHRLGGFAIAAHPDSPKPELRWREWLAPVDGVEWLNADSAWRDESRRTMARALFTYFRRPAETIVALFDRPTTTLARWDALSRRRHVIALAGHDAHARLGARGAWDGPPGDETPFTLKLPSYFTAFKAFSVGVELEAPPARSDAAADARQLLDAVRRGHTFTVIDGLDGPARLRFGASADGLLSRGDEVPRDQSAFLTLFAEVPSAPAGATVQILKDGAVVASGHGRARIAHRSSTPAVYRAEVQLPGAPGAPPIPWMLSNAIRVGFPAAQTAPALLPAVAWSRPLPQRGWAVEQHQASVTELSAAILTPESTAWTLVWRLGGGPPSGQYAAAAVPVGAGALEGADRVSFTARGSVPLRMSVQLRSHARSGARWRRSVYVSETPAVISIPLREFTPVDDPPTALDPAAIDSVLFVVDTVNAAPGSRGELTVSALRVEGAGGAARQVRTVSSR